MLLVLVTGAASVVLEGSLLSRGWNGAFDFAMILAGLLLTGGSANAFNMYLERNIDSQMARTRNRRPLPKGTIKPLPALIFAIIIGITGVLIFALRYNLLSTLLALGTIVFYSFFYTLYLKPRTPYNTVIGGIAGSMAPVIAWAAVTNAIMLAPILLFAIVFLWTPPHFWALALYMKKDYELVSYPMMPVVIGDSATKRQMLSYVTVLVVLSTACLMVGAGWFYLLVALTAGAIFIVRTLRLLSEPTNRLARGLFGYSIIYLFAVFTGLMLDKIITLIF